MKWNNIIHKQVSERVGTKNEPGKARAREREAAGSDIDWINGVMY